MIDLPSGFYNAESMWLNPPVEKEESDIIERADKVIEAFPLAGINTVEELDEAIDAIETTLTELKRLRSQI